MNRGLLGNILRNTIPTIALLCIARKSLADCPNPTDLKYVIKKGDELASIARDNYGVRATPMLTDVWLALGCYNRGRINENFQLIYAAQELCLPTVLRTTCGSYPRVTGSTDKSSQATKNSPTGTYGNEQQAGGEVCGGANLGESSCLKPGSAEGSLECGSDSRACDSPKCGSQETPLMEATKQTLLEKQAAPEKPTQPKEIIVFILLPREQSQSSTAATPFGIALEVSAGYIVPLSETMRRDVFPGFAPISIGARLAVGRLELTPRAHLVVGSHDTLFNDQEQPQSILGGGAGMQLGLPLRWKRFHLTPGVETSFLYVRREIDRIDYPYEGTIEEQKAWIPLAGVFLRPEWVAWRSRRSSKTRLTVGLEASLMAFFTDGVRNVWTDNFGLKAAGGASYAF